MKESTQDLDAARGSLIVDRLGTILGFDEDFEQLTGWQAISQRRRNIC